MSEAKTVLQSRLDREKQNMAVWNALRTPDRQYVKHCKFGKREFHTVDAQYTFERATNKWGPYGMLWRLVPETEEWREITVDDRVSLMLSATFEYKIPMGGTSWAEGSFRESADQKFTHGDDTSKKVRTALISKALSRIGVNADIYMGKWDDDGYASQTVFASSPDNKKYTRILSDIGKAGSASDLDVIASKVEVLTEQGTLSNDLAAALAEELEAKRGGFAATKRQKAA